MLAANQFLAVAISLCFSAVTAKTATIEATSVKLADVQAAITQAAHGDTVNIPAGTASWTKRLTITKGITLKGQTTVKGAGTASPTVNDLTVIQDDLPSAVQKQSGGIYVLLNKATQAMRITGISFTHGTRDTTGTAQWYIHFDCSDRQPNKLVRLDHCHLYGLRMGKLIGITGWIYGLADNNVVDTNYTVAGKAKRAVSFVGTMAGYGGPTLLPYRRQQGGAGGEGNGAWADFGWFGTDKFFFVETNTVYGGTATKAGGTDGDHGWRCVFRHNYLNNVVIGDHGTEGGSARGRRAYEIYDNIFNWTKAHGSPISNRSGNSIIHDNTFTGTAGNQPVISNPDQFRQVGGVSAKAGFRPAADSRWDRNDTDGHGNFVEGQPAYLYESGTVTQDSVKSSAGVTLTDTSKHWTTNQWVDAAGGTSYQIRNMNPKAAPYRKSASIISNTENTITCSFYDGGDRGPDLIWLNGDAYDIHRVLTTIDQTGRGKGDLVNKLINVRTGTQMWTRQLVEPSFSWNNVQNPGNVELLFNATRCKTCKQGRDYYDLGIGKPADSYPSTITSILTAEVNGVQYAGDFTYPHPLTIEGTPTPTPTASGSSSSLKEP